MRDLRSRLLFSKALFGVFVVSIAWTVANFVAPFTIPPGAFANTTGSANAIDHWDIYTGAGFNAFATVVYTVGDVQCHQLYYRSYSLNGNQMPMDARMESIYLFAPLGLLIAMLATPSTSVAQGIVNALPRRIQGWTRKHLGPTKTAFLVVLLGLLPIAVDGFYQLFSDVTHYESTNLTRVLTGIPSGIVSGLLVGVMLTSIRQVSIEVEELRAAAQPSR